jgi:hypothetical protein
VSESYYVIGTAIYVWSEVEDRDRNATDPDDLTLRLMHPDGTEDTVAKASLNRESLGRYSHEFVVDDEGIWRWRFESAEPTAADEGSFRVSASAFA